MPEEINRRMMDHASDILFAPSEAAVEQLRSEGITDSVHNVGNVMYDSILWAREQAAEHATILDDLGVAADEYILSTVHRAANTDNPGRLESILKGLIEAPPPVVFPAHP